MNIKRQRKFIFLSEISETENIKVNIQYSYLLNLEKDTEQYDCFQNQDIHVFFINACS